MTTLFDTSLSASVIRPPYASADAPSMADSLPNINFGFEELRERMARFTKKFDAFISDGRQRVLAEHNEHRKRLAELEGKPKSRFSFSQCSLCPILLSCRVSH